MCSHRIGASGWRSASPISEPQAPKPIGHLRNHGTKSEISHRNHPDRHQPTAWYPGLTDMQRPCSPATQCVSFLSGYRRLCLELGNVGLGVIVGGEGGDCLFPRLVHETVELLLAARLQIVETPQSLIPRPGIGVTLSTTRHALLSMATLGAHGHFRAQLTEIRGVDE